MTGKASNSGQWFVRAFETNYNLDKRIPADGSLSIGQLTAKLVEELGESVF